MTERGRSNSVFGVAPGADFASALVDGLITRFGDRPEALARVRVYLNSGRMLRRVQEVFDSGPARLLPRLDLITGIGAATSVLAAPDPLALEFELAQLIGALGQQRADFALGRSRFDLASSVATLISEMDDEAVPLASLAALQPEAHAEHWSQNLAILTAAYDYAARNPDIAPSAEAHRRSAVTALVSQWQHAPPDHPVVIAGSTGSRGTTRLLMQAVAALPSGHVVLPGFDGTQSAEDWARIAQTPAAEDHPQGRYASFLAQVGLDPTAIPDWAEGHEPPVPARNRLVSMALRPAPYTDSWRRDGPGFDAIGAATEGLTLIEADSLAEEAMAIAVRLRQAAECGQKAALVTPDRVLARQVSAALDRWSVIPDDSGGQPLHLSPPGRFLRLSAQLLSATLTTSDLLSALKHPLAASAPGQRGGHLKQTRRLELYLRRNGIAYPTAKTLENWRDRAMEERKEWTNWLIATAFGPEPLPKSTLQQLVVTHVAAATHLAAGPGGDAPGELWLRDSGAAAQTMMQALADRSDALGPIAVTEYLPLLTRQMALIPAYDPVAAHSDILIWGTLEARVQSADLILLGGLNEGSWPGSLPTDLWLNRDMRAAVGLRLPERQIGLAAHDFQQAIGAQEVVLSRSLRSDGAETVPSRWLNRLLNLLDGISAEGAAALEAMQARGQRLITLSHHLHQPDAPIAAAPRPSPSPPVESRPKKLPVTQITRLVRDPYAVYARYVLRLKPLDPIQPEPDYRRRGILFHRIMQRLVGPDRALPESAEAARQQLQALAAGVLDQGAPWPAIAALWQARLLAKADPLIALEHGRAAQGAVLLQETTGQLPLDGIDFTLTAKVDRIDRLGDGRFAVVDYKTSSPPSVKQVDQFDKQLVLEAALLERGGFDAIPRGAEVAGLAYISILNAATTTIDLLTDEGARRPDQAWEELHRLITRYQSAATGYTARRAIERQNFEGDYDHLSRFGEWDIDAVPSLERLAP